jgi:hypothetical protein
VRNSPDHGSPCLGAIFVFGLLLSFFQLSCLAIRRLPKAFAWREGQISFWIGQMTGKPECAGINRHVGVSKEGWRIQ